MIFLASKLPFEAVQLQNQLRLTTGQYVDVYLSVEEAEANLYKMPDVVLLDDNLGLNNLLYLSQSIKIYDSKIEIIWFCQESYDTLEKLQNSYGVDQCFRKADTSLELISFTVMEICNRQQENMQQKRKEYLRKNLLNALL